MPREPGGGQPIAQGVVNASDGRDRLPMVRTVHGVVRWRRVDLRDELQRRFGVALHERSVGKILQARATANCR